MTLKNILKQDAAAMYQATDGLFGLVDEDTLEWKPPTGSNWMTVGQLMQHCTEACGTTVKGFVTGEWGWDTSDPDAASFRPAEQLSAVSSVAEAKRLLAADRDMTMQILDEVSDDRLANEQVAAPWGGPERTLFEQVNGMIWHLGQHKGQLYYYLKLQGKDVNTWHLWRGGAPE